MSVRNFEKFEVGHYYIYTGEKKNKFWNSEGNMDFVLNHKPCKCIFTGIACWDADFESKPRLDSHGSYWSWHKGFDNWIEIKDPNKIWNVLRGEKFYNITDNKILTVYQGHINPNPITSLPCGSLNNSYALIDSKCENDYAVDECEFKVGDRVEIVKKLKPVERIWVNVMNGTINQIGKVVNINNYGDVHVKVDSGDRTYHKDSLELVSDTPKFKIRDMVKIIKKSDPSSTCWVGSMDQFIGKIGEIIDFRESNNSGCNKDLRINFGFDSWWFPEETVEKVSDKVTVYDTITQDQKLYDGNKYVNIGDLSGTLSVSPIITTIQKNRTSTSDYLRDAKSSPHKFKDFNFDEALLSISRHKFIDYPDLLIGKWMPPPLTMGLRSPSMDVYDGEPKIIKKHYIKLEY